MNIGIIVYSQTGNTLSVAQKLKEKLTAAGHIADIEQIIVTGDVSPGKRQFVLTAIPTVDPYEGLVFATPVQAFSLNPVMAAYLEQLPSLNEKKFACLITKHLPFSWTGGKQAIAKMKNVCTARGAAFRGAEIAVWSGSRRPQNIENCVNNLSKLF
jgi:NAD(P)H dehydrogenase (quinone)